MEERPVVEGRDGRVAAEDGQSTHKKSLFKACLSCRIPELPPSPIHSSPDAPAQRRWQKSQEGNFDVARVRMSRSCSADDDPWPRRSIYSLYHYPNIVEA